MSSNYEFVISSEPTSYLQVSWYKNTSKYVSKKSLLDLIESKGVKDVVKIVNVVIVKLVLLCRILKQKQERNKRYQSFAI